MAKQPRISINAFEKAVGKDRKKDISVDWNGMSITVTPRLSFADMMAFIDGVVKSCFTKDGLYVPEAKDIAIKSNILEMYANFRLPENIEKAYELIADSDAVETVLSYINTNQLQEIVRCIDERLEDRLSSRADSAATIYNRLIDIEHRLSDLMSGISPDSLANMMSAIADGGLDEEKLMQAYFKQRDGQGVVAEEEE